MSVFIQEKNYHDGKPLPTQEELQQLFTYDDELGVLRWKESRANNKIKAGDVAGTLKKDGYTQVTMDCEIYYAHRLIWVYHNGEIPSGLVIDHKVSEDDQPKNNKIDNLQLATPSQNNFKARKQKNNTSGFPGVCWDISKKKWVARYQNDSGELIYIGYYTNKYEAYHAAAEASAKVAGDFYTEKQLSVQDRHAYIDWLIEQNPNPDYDWMSVTPD